MDYFTTYILSSKSLQLNGTTRADIEDDALIFKTCIYQTARGNICDDSPPVNTTVTLADVSSTGANRQEAPSR